MARLPERITIPVTLWLDVVDRVSLTFQLDTELIARDVTEAVGNLTSTCPPAGIPPRGTVSFDINEPPVRQGTPAEPSRGASEHLHTQATPSVTSTRPATGRACIDTELTRQTLSPFEYDLLDAMRWTIVGWVDDIERARRVCVLEGPGLPNWEPGLHPLRFQSIDKLVAFLIERSRA